MKFNKSAFRAEFLQVKSRVQREETSAEQIVLDLK